jgi:hypothetical protein
MIEFDIATPASREQVLLSILPESAKQHHQMLRQLFAAKRTMNISKTSIGALSCYL